ncbi:MAG: hypothetical protein QOH90_1284 [Actinomycetota bacterium]|jgi:hypothetical protein|nr:hypothetical protein [Actinomycetota bacterium]
MKWRWLALAAGVVIAVNLVTGILGYLYGSPTGPTSSSYATTPEGAGALAELLGRGGHVVSQLRAPLADADLDLGATLVVLDPNSIDRRGEEALKRFVENGGWLVGGGNDPEWLSGVVDGLPTWTPDGEERVSEGQAPEIGEVRSVETAGSGSWLGTGSGSAVIGDPERPLAIKAVQGSGTALLVADVSPLQNRLLDRADNAAFALTLVDPQRTDVVFAEAEHGYRTGSGLTALPSGWKWFLFGLFVATIAWMLAKGRRLGPPEEATRPLPPPRIVYVHALAATLARTERRRRPR